ncbi:MAG: hypothetical protein FWH40_05165 [Coriobacteriia bacterium]|nr:hypothetical protein [Coriobacteriia bacterium]
MPGMNTKQQAWDDKKESAKKLYGNEEASFLSRLASLDSTLNLVQAKLDSYSEVTGIDYSNQGRGIDLLTLQGDGLTRYAGSVNSELLEAVNTPLMASLTQISEKLGAIDWRSGFPSGLLEQVVDIDYDAVFDGSEFDPAFEEALRIRSAMYEIDQLVRDQVILLDDPNDIDTLLGLEDSLLPDVEELLIALGFASDDSIRAILQGYFEKQIRIVIFEHKAIHDYVKNQVVMQTGGETEVSIKNGGVKPGGGTNGYMDIYNFSTGEVWEIKSRRQEENGKDQVSRYEGAGEHKDNKEKFPLGVTGGHDIEPFTIELGDYVITVDSAAMRIEEDTDEPVPSGVVIYDYMRTDPEVNSQENEAYEPSPDSVTSPAIVPGDSRDPVPSGQDSAPGFVIDWEKVAEVVFVCIVVVGIVVLCVVCPPVGIAVAAACIGMFLFDNIPDILPDGSEGPTT